MELSNANLSSLPNDIQKPNYDRSVLRAGIVHIGLGNFHRAHQAWYLQQLMQQGLAMDWAIIGAGVRTNDEAQRLRLEQQDFLTTLIKLDPRGRSAEVVGSMIGYVGVEEGNRPLIKQMSDPSIRIVSLTVTEGGYYIDPATKRFDAGHTDIKHDALYPETPTTAFGAIIAALKIRRDTKEGPFTCQSCDNLQGNGDILRQTIVSLARLSDAALADWIDQNCTFPNSMVDCIVPATGSKELAIAREFGVDDAAPVTHENFRQWVIEDNFCAGRPEWDKVGVTFVENVHAHEVMKIRILNGGHQIVSNAGELLSVEYISDCLANDSIKALFRKIALEEISPQVSSVPNMDPETYVELIDSRFSNPEIVDTVRRVAFDGSARHTGFILPTLRDALASASPIDGLALTEALWARLCAGTREDGTDIEPNDPSWSKLNAVAKAAKTEPILWLQQSELYGDLSENLRFKTRFEHWLRLIWRDGTMTAIQKYTQG